MKNGLKEFLLNNKNKIFMTSVLINRDSSDAWFLNVNWPKVVRKQYNMLHPFRLFRRGIMFLYSLGWNFSPNNYEFPKELSFYHGSSWFCIPVETAKYIIDFLKQNEWYYSAFKNALCPDEWFFQTIIMNSKYRSDVVNDNLVYLKWGHNVKNRNHPITFTMGDVNLIKNSNQYFARKFDQNIDETVIEYFVNSIKM